MTKGKYHLVRTARFERKLEKFTSAHPELKERLTRVFRDLESDPLEPRLRLHPLQGNLAGLHAISINYDYRIALRLFVSERRIELMGIGTHNEVYR
ncbi:MAG: type II toxin-antitoxin system mRNA interferase toxin, RelE/StbE family [Bdellovibrionota bacterium]